MTKDTQAIDTPRENAPVDGSQTQKPGQTGLKNLLDLWIANDGEADPDFEQRKRELEQGRDGWLPIETAPKYAGAIIALSPAWEDGKSPIILRWFQYNGTEAWRDWDNDPHFPTHYLPWPFPTERGVKP